MKSSRILRAAAVFLVTVMPACATTQTTSTTWTDPNAGGGYTNGYPYGNPYGRAGQVQSIQEVVQRTEGNPVGGAIAGALIGAALFGGRGPEAAVGAAGGAAVGASASQGSSERRTYNVVVRFDDGAYATFTYYDYSPFRPGERVVLTPQGLAHS